MKNKILDVIPARLDFIQGLSGFVLALFIMGHLLFEASILLGNEAMYRVTLMFEGYYLFGNRYPEIITFLAASISIVFIVHAAIALRKFPDNYRQHKTMKKHVLDMKHEDTSLWIIQLTTGFVMFFIGSVHLYIMMAEPSNIGPFLSSFRVVKEHMGPLYFLLLISVVTHAFIGLYRLALKWGFMEGKSTKVSRARFKFLMKSFIFVYLLIGFASLAKYVYLGYTHDFENYPKYEQINKMHHQ